MSVYDDLRRVTLGFVPGGNLRKRAVADYSRCPHCGGTLDPDTGDCPDCHGNPYQHYCPVCGTPKPEDEAWSDVNCPQCGPDNPITTGDIKGFDDPRQYGHPDPWMDNEPGSVKPPEGWQ